MSESIKFQKQVFNKGVYSKVINTDFTVFKNEPFLLKVEFFGNKITIYF